MAKRSDFVMPTTLVEILRCANHRQILAVAIGGIRLSPFKCCGAWTQVAHWTVPISEFVDVVGRAAVERAPSKGFISVSVPIAIGGTKRRRKNKP